MTATKKFEKYIEENPVIGNKYSVSKFYSIADNFSEFDSFFADFVPGWVIKEAWSLASKAHTERLLNASAEEFNAEVEKYL